MQYSGRWHADEVVPLPYKGGYIPFRALKVVFFKYTHAEFFHAPPSTLKSVSVREGVCKLVTTFTLAVTAEKGKIEISGCMPDRVQLDKSMVFKPRKGPDVEQTAGRHRRPLPLPTIAEDTRPPLPPNASAFERLQDEMRAAHCLTIYKEPNWPCEVKRQKGKGDGHESN